MSFPACVRVIAPPRASRRHKPGKAKGPKLLLANDGSATAHLPLDGYIRISRVGDRGGESFISPDVQAKAITRKCDEIGRAVHLHDPEENRSGGTMNRPIFNTIMERIASGQSGGIVVYKLDRFARNLLGGYQALTEIASRGAVFVSASEPHFDFSTPSGRMILQQHLMFAEYFRAISTEEWRGSVTHAVDRGVNTAPYGAYGYIADVAGRLHIEPDEAPFVFEAYRMRAEDRITFPAIAEYLNENAPPNLARARAAARRRAQRDAQDEADALQAQAPPWVGPSVQRMLARRIYRGEVRYGVEQNTTNRDPIVNTNAHTPIVSEDLWQAAQAPVHSFSKKRKGEPALLQGLVRCAGCRYIASPGLAGGVRQYGCRGKYVSGKCPAPASITSARLNEYIDRIVAAELHRRRGAFTGSSDSKELDKAARDLREAQSALVEMRQDTTARKRLGARWLDFVEPYVLAEDRAAARVREITSQLTETMRGMTSDAYLELPPGERRLVLGEMIDAVMLRRRPPNGPRRNLPPLDDSRVLVFWRGQAPVFPTKSRFTPEGITSFQWPEDETKAVVLAS